jgi:peptide/nickel transport system permease protein
MWSFILRRILWTVPIVTGVVLITFVLFAYVAPDPARLEAGKHATPQQLQKIRQQMRLDKPRWLNTQAAKAVPGLGPKLAAVTDSQFVDVLLWRLPDSQHYKEPLWSLLLRKAPASLAIAGPVFFVALGIQLVLALVAAHNRGRWPDYSITFMAVLGICVPGLSVIILAQWLVGFELGWFPVAGWGRGAQIVHFAVLPILVETLVSLGGGVRFYRTVMLEEIYTDYVRTARAKGVANRDVLLVHVLRNAMIPVITNTVASLPFLLLGSLLVETMFQIPGLGNLMVEAIGNRDRSIIMGMTYAIAVVYTLMLLVTDICYALVDPRIRLQ